MCDSCIRCCCHTLSPGRTGVRFSCAPERSTTWSALLMPRSRHSRTALLCVDVFPLFDAASIGRMLIPGGDVQECGSLVPGFAAAREPTTCPLCAACNLMCCSSCDNGRTVPILRQVTVPEPSFVLFSYHIF